MSRIDPQLLGYELAIRGRAWGDLRKGPHRMSVNTVTKLRAGVRVDQLYPSTLQALRDWLQATPVDPGLKAVITRPSSTAEPAS